MASDARPRHLEKITFMGNVAQSDNNSLVMQMPRNARFRTTCRYEFPSSQNLKPEAGVCVDRKEDESNRLKTPILASDCQVESASDTYTGWSVKRETLTESSESRDLRIKA